MATLEPHLEYRVRTVNRYIVTRFESGPQGGSVTERGEYDNADVAYEAATALCKMEHHANGGTPGDMRFIYPEHPKMKEAVPQTDAEVA